MSSSSLSSSWYEDGPIPGGNEGPIGRLPDVEEDGGGIEGPATGLELGKAPDEGIAGPIGLLTSGGNVGPIEGPDAAPTG